MASPASPVRAARPDPPRQRAPPPSRPRRARARAPTGSARPRSHQWASRAMLSNLKILTSPSPSPSSPSFRSRGARRRRASDASSAPSEASFAGARSGAERPPAALRPGSSSGVQRPVTAHFSSARVLRLVAHLGAVVDVVAQVVVPERVTFIRGAPHPRSRGARRACPARPTRRRAQKKHCCSGTWGARPPPPPRRAARPRGTGGGTTRSRGGGGGGRPRGREPAVEKTCRIVSPAPFSSSLIPGHSTQPPCVRHPLARDGRVREPQGRSTRKRR